MNVILLLALAVVPHDPVECERCDLIELNHFYDDEGKHRFDQLIFWDWDPRDCRYQVRAWRMVRPNWRARWDWKRGCCMAYGIDGEMTREVRSDLWRESWEQYDPELVEREIIHKEHRRELKGCRRDTSP